VLRTAATAEAAAAAADIDVFVGTDEESLQICLTSDSTLKLAETCA
jgi:hypothetical protein